MQELSAETAEFLPDREVMSSSCCKPRNYCEPKPCEPRPCDPCDPCDSTLIHVQVACIADVRIL
jgi:hypothetical protein